MADGPSTANANLALNALTGTNQAYVQLHTGDPGSAGTSNVSSVTTRAAITWAAASGGSVVSSNTQTWSSWAGTNGEVVTDISFWSASSSGTFGGSMVLAAAETMHTGDSLELLSVTWSTPTAS
jgi:hypothetical protein